MSNIEQRIYFRGWMLCNLESHWSSLYKLLFLYLMLSLKSLCQTDNRKTGCGWEQGQTGTCKNRRRHGMELMKTNWNSCLSLTLSNFKAMDTQKLVSSPHSCTWAKLPGALNRPSQLPHFHLPSLMQIISYVRCKPRIMQRVSKAHGLA